MINSPGGIQVAGDLTLARDKRLIQSVVLEIRVKQETPPKKTSDPETDVGLQSAIALFTGDSQRIRFVTDYRIVDQQLSPTMRCLTFTYTPETPEQMLGKEVAFLERIDKLVANYAEIFRTVGFATGGEPTALDLAVRLNGIEVVAEKGGFDATGSLARGQVAFEVGPLFQRIPEVYEGKISSTAR